MKLRSEMAKMNFIFALVGKKKWRRKLRKSFQKGSSHSFDSNKGNGTQQVKLEKLKTSPKKKDLNSRSFGISVPSKIQGGSPCKVKVIKEENPIHVDAVESAYEGSDDCDGSLSMKRDPSDFDLQAQVADKGDEPDPLVKIRNSSSGSVTEMNDRLERDEGGLELIHNGHQSDPGIRRIALWGSPTLTRSCSSVETRDLIKKIANQVTPSKSHSFEDLQDLADGARREIVQGIQTSPLSVYTSFSADRVMLKRRASSHVLPSRNTLESRWVLAAKENNTESSGLLSISPKDNNFNSYNKQSWDKFHRGDSGPCPPNHWIAFCNESSPPSRVDEWVRSFESHSVVPQDDCCAEGEETGDSSVVPPFPETSKSPGRTPSTTGRSNLNVSEEVLQANNVIQSLNSFSKVAHIASIGLKVIPCISSFTSLRSVNLSGNFVVHITPGSLPKDLHTLNLSRNKIAAIEGLRELTRLRVLDLSYNRITRIGQGLSNCIIIKELYLTGNKISDVEGLHRLLKLAVLDLNFNRITTTKSLGQLVANHKSLLALNLLGNPIQSNIGDDQVWRTVSNLLPKLTYLNKQPIKPLRAREAVSDNVTRAALGNNGWSSRRKVSTWTTQGSSSRSRISNGVAHRSRHRARNNGRR
ncbi:hypothetical protein MRB53_021970 [Persea americana]|uniref:Uncharacterized protein n=1 Tax=Persea americana TaxID=3435 RepID=A0ACC2L5B0_PERAE|nr:hypothetical protein MRB53_021970 [Persea americana]